MVRVNRITFVHPDGDRVERINRGQVTYQGGMPRVKVDADKPPDWAQLGMDVVAAYDDGSVEAAIEVAHMSVELRPPSCGPRKRIRVYR